MQQVNRSSSSLSSYSKDNTKIIVLGIGTVGKSSVTIRFTMNTFTDDYVATVQDTLRKNVVIDGELAQLEILDTAGQEEYKVMQDLWIKQGKGYVLVYAINNSDSFKELKEIYEKIMKIKKNNKIPIVICANKIDLENEDRQVSDEEGRQFAKSIDAQYIETSAKMGLNCNQVFEDLVRKIRSCDKNANKPVKVKKSFWDKCQLI